MSLICCGSRSLKPGEERYATVELECLAITWAPGKTHLIADALPHAPVFTPPEDNIEDEEIAECFAITTNLAVHDKITPCINESYVAVCEALEKDKRLAKLPVDHPSKSFRGVWHQLSTDATLILIGDRIAVPKPAQAKIMALLHIPHNGIVKTLQAARQMYYWPRMTFNITSLVEKCEACQGMRPSQCHEKLQPSMAKFPMEMVSNDIFEFSTHHYLIMADRYSGYPWIHQLHQLHTDAITSTLHSWFLQYGFPLTIRTDGGPPFCQEFKKFCEDNNIHPELYSLHNAQSNGHAEASVKNMKYLLSKCSSFNEEFQRSLCEWCNSPATSQDSPNQLLFGRTLRTTLPALDKLYQLRDN